MNIFSTSAMRKRQWKWWAAVVIVICLLLAYHAHTAWRFKQIENNAQVVEMAISSYPTLSSNVTVRALPVKGIVLVEGHVQTESDLLLLRKIVASTGLGVSVECQVAP
jgi:ABC-type spermidine/putrescine transport system permease subunit I